LFGFSTSQLEEVGKEVKQVLPQGTFRKHKRTDSNGSNTTTSSRSNTLHNDKMARSNSQRARSQLFETHLAKLFKQKVEIFTKVEFTQESVVTTTVKLCLKSLQEYVRLQTFNRSGFQQIQLDIQFLKAPLKEAVEDEAAIDFLLDEVVTPKAPSFTFLLITIKQRLYVYLLQLTIDSPTMMCVCIDR